MNRVEHGMIPLDDVSFFFTIFLHLAMTKVCSHPQDTCCTCLPLNAVNSFGTNWSPSSPNPSCQPCQSMITQNVYLSIFVASPNKHTIIFYVSLSIWLMRWRHLWHTRCALLHMLLQPLLVSLWFWTLRLMWEHSCLLYLYQTICYYCIILIVIIVLHVIQFYIMKSMIVEKFLNGRWNVEEKSIPPWPNLNYDEWEYTTWELNDTCPVLLQPQL